ncbi:hypothetical protein SAMN04487897_104221 [Paenibacillus sp. yr247]|uniref:hypothetical protein n=1 Tax=Paenibacillus sp. yr247 TaxID=1761880 RepID=UPI000885C275|nr:hypothetical protein [Paenibacillus sp. yr247]SDN72929.1 hypothetical protein SAMN04487897_104221 [Paenibacillus sp. yr247]
MKNQVLIIKMNLLPWYNELDDLIDVNNSEFPAPARERILTFGEYSIITISRYETRLRKKTKDS